MATLITETQWHANPRPILAYASSLENGVVASPYYLDGRNVPVHEHFVTAQPLGDLTPAAAILVAGPATTVSGDVDGVWVNGAGLNVGITVTGGTNISTSIVNGSTAITSDQFAAQIAAVLNTLGAGEVLASAAGNVVTIVAQGAVTALTITTWAVA